MATQCSLVFFWFFFNENDPSWVEGGLVTRLTKCGLTTVHDAIHKFRFLNMILASSHIPRLLMNWESDWLLLLYILTTVTSLMYCLEVWITSLNTTLHTASAGRNHQKCHNTSILQNLSTIQTNTDIYCICNMLCLLHRVDYDFLPHSEHSERKVTPLQLRHVILFVKHRVLIFVTFKTCKAYM